MPNMNIAMQPQNRWRLMPSPKIASSGAGRRRSQSPASSCCALYGNEFSALAHRKTTSTELPTMISSNVSTGYNNYLQRDSITKIDCNAKNGYFDTDTPRHISPIRSDEPSHGPLKKRRLRADTLEQARLESFPTVTPVPRINAGNTIAINEHFSSITRAASFIEYQQASNNPPFEFMSAGDPYSMILQAPQLIPYQCATKKEIERSDSRKDKNARGRSDSFSSSAGGVLSLPIRGNKMPIRGPTRCARQEDNDNVNKLRQFVQSDLLRPTRLARPEDVDNVNKLHQFVRSDLLEIFEVQNGSGCTFEGRVGLRCSFCKHVPKDEQSTGAVFYPRNIRGLYRNVCTWQRVHFKNCKCMPEDVRQKYNMLKINDKSRGKTSYWDLSARALGLQDTEQNDGRVGVKFI